VVYYSNGLKKTSNTQEWLAQRFPTVFERDSNLGLVNTSRFKPQTTYEKNTDCMDDFQS